MVHFAAVPPFPALFPHRLPREDYGVPEKLDSEILYPVQPRKLKSNIKILQPPILARPSNVAGGIYKTRPVSVQYICAEVNGAESG